MANEAAQDRVSLLDRDHQAADDVLSRDNLYHADYFQLRDLVLHLRVDLRPLVGLALHLDLLVLAYQLREADRICQLILLVVVLDYCLATFCSHGFGASVGAFYGRVALDLTVHQLREIASL